MRCVAGSRFCGVVSPVLLLFVGSFPKEGMEKTLLVYAAGGH